MKMTLDMIYIILLAAWGFIPLIIAFKQRSDMKQFAPEAEEIIKARKDRQPLVIVVENSKNMDMFVPPLLNGLRRLTSKKHDYGLTFDPLNDSGSMYHKNDLQVFFAVRDHVESITPHEAAAVNALAAFKPEEVDERRWWQLLRMNEQELKDNKALLNLENEGDVAKIVEWKKQLSEKVKIKDGVFTWDCITSVLNRAHSASHVQNLETASIAKGALVGSVNKAQLILIGTLAFGAFLVCIGAGIAYTMIK